MSFVLRDAEKIVCAVILLAMTLLGFANVVVRYLTNYSLAATEELLTNGFLLLTIFGAAIAARKGEHLAVTIVYDLSPPRARKAILIVANVLSVVLLLLAAWFCWQLAMNEYRSGLRSYGLQLPAWYYSAGLPLGFLLVMVRFVQHAVDTWRGVGDEVQPDV
ncbi:TRAP transporter small permease [Lutibaculum baratangense]|uniref:TRAP transporter small permease protein n=1 Tax=Lutibaculum baratangense AMV1 TaxID=631454 RepID=V4QVQ5_9HYPH|nr:TRAP transporter small permease [Lutibaculum baratangense]ESR23837.1 TRAP-type transport system, small permease component, predicted N-acetylneuraminate transporter [Lutibaculum baratangense AMV1]